MEEPTERTLLTRPNERTSYAGAMNNRRRKIHQCQCCFCAFIVATFVMALIVTVSYTVNHPEIFPQDDDDDVTNVTGNLVQSTGQRPNLKQSKPPTGLTDEEIQKAKDTGRAALEARWQADLSTNPLPSPSPNTRHQIAVSTSSLANRIGLVGVAEIAATREIENNRSFMGKPSSMGSYFDGGWLPEVVCPIGSNIVCPAVPSKYRRFDGACNHPENLGMAYTPFMRSLPPDYADGISAPRVGKFGNPLPSARLISRKVHPPSPSTNPSFTVMLAVFGQFLDHDITATADSRGRNGSSLSCCPPSGDGSHPECFNVLVGPGDPFYDAGGSSCMEFVRSAPAAQCKIGPRQQLNQVTSFIDGSTIYGADVNTAEGLREFSSGRLRMQITPDNRELLPVSTNPNDGCNRQTESAAGRYCFASGDKRANENLHLTTMHLLWARQHNRLAEQLAEVNPHWDDETLYQETRRIVGAQLQHITYREFLPIVLGEDETRKRGLKPLATGFRARNDSDVDPSIANHFSAAAFRFAHTLIPGLIKMTDTEKGTSSWVQLHQLLFNPYSLYDEGGVESSITSATSNAIQKTSTHVTSQLTEHLFEDPTRNSTTAGCGLDLVSLNIQRGRDHGLPGYVKWREYCGLEKPLKFADLKDELDPDSLQAISKLYDNVDDVDLYTGALAEWPKGDGLVGPTFTCLIAAQFERLQSADKYWYEAKDQPGAFSEDQLQELRKTSLAGIICDTSHGITDVQAHVMRSVGPDNPIISCEDIPKPSLTPWKNDIPTLTLTTFTVPMVDWIKYKNEVNQTIDEIVSNIIAKRPPPGSLPADWSAFQEDINKTFTDLKNKFSALHPKTVTLVSLGQNPTADPNSFDWEALKGQVNSTVQDVINYIYANKPPPGSLPADWAAYRKSINDSLMDFRKKFNVFHPKDTSQKSSPNLKQVGEVPVIDWTELKNDVNKTIIDVVNSINGSKPLPGSSPADWFAFRKKINDTLAGIKDKFKGLHPKTPIQKLGEPNGDSQLDWTELKNELKRTLEEIIESKEPSTSDTPAGTNWKAFQQDVNNTLDQLINDFTGLNKTNSSDIVPDNNANKTIAEIVAEIKASKPPPGSPQADWVAYSQKMVKAFTEIRSKNISTYANKTYKTKVKAISTPVDFDVVAFREDLNKTLTDLLSVIKNKKPTVDSPVTDWLEYKKEIKDSVNKIKNQVAGIKTKELMGTEYATDSTFDWIGWKNQINSTIDGLIAEVKTIPPGDPKWASFGKSLNKTFTDLKKKITTVNLLLKSSQPVVTLMPIISNDLTDFKDRINSTIEDALDDINGNMPPAGDPSWLSYNNYIKSRFAKMREDVKAIKSEFLEKVKMATEVMTVTASELPSGEANSASSFQSKLPDARYQLRISILFLSTVLLVR